MIYFFLSTSKAIFAVQVEQNLSSTDISKLNWLFGGTQLSEETVLAGVLLALVQLW